MKILQSQPQGRAHVAGVLTIIVFSALSLASGKSKSSGTSATGSAAPAGSAGGDPSKTATLVGSCDRSDQFYLDCSESFAPSTVSDQKRQCDTLGGKFRVTPCPRINAITQCFEGNAPSLFGNYGYEGRKTKTEPDDCPRGFRDLKKDPELKPNPSPASCNAVATGGVCSQYSAVTVESEKDCLDSGGKLKQPPEPCPTSNGLAAFKIPLKDGTTETDYFYTTPYTDATGTHTWQEGEIALICGLAGSNCTKVSFASAAGAASAQAAAPAAASGVASAKPSPKPNKKK